MDASACSISRRYLQFLQVTRMTLIHAAFLQKVLGEEEAGMAMYIT